MPLGMTFSTQQTGSFKQHSANGIEIVGRFVILGSKFRGSPDPN
jgi:hypothetical protein